jgi:hypothetical protein
MHHRDKIVCTIRDVVCNSRPTCICAFCVRRNRTESPRDEQRRLAAEFVEVLLKSRMG